MFKCKVTLADLEDLSKQDIYDIISYHLLTQHKQSTRLFDESNPYWDTWAYRGREDTACAIGAVIPDSVYERKLEGHTALELILRRRELELDSAFVSFLQRHLALLLYLQHIHDDYDVSEWPTKLAEVAAKFALVP